MEAKGTDRRKDAFCVELVSRIPLYAVELHVFYFIPKFAAYLAASHGALTLHTAREIPFMYSFSG